MVSERTEALNKVFPPGTWHNQLKVRHLFQENYQPWQDLLTKDDKARVTAVMRDSSFLNWRFRSVEVRVPTTSEGIKMSNNGEFSAELFMELIAHDNWTWQ